MVIREAVQSAAQTLGRREADMLVQYVTGLDRTQYLLSQNQTLTDAQLEQLQNAVDRRRNQEPLQYILGEQEFMSLPFAVNPHVLIPRGDTETLVEEAIALIPESAKVLDIGTGSGCIAVSLAHYRKDLSVTAADFSTDALETASGNIRRNGVEDRVFTLLCDIMKECPNGQFDAVISNPPYIEKEIVPTLEREVKDFEPITALDGGVDGLDFYRRIIRLSPKLMPDGGQLFFEVGYTQAEAVAALMRLAGLSGIRKVCDLCGVERVVLGTLSKKERETE